MIKSMTGYGRAQGIISGREISVEIRSVNHRYFELVVRVPRAYSYLEDKVKSLIQSQVSRGKMEVSLTLNSETSDDASIEVNMGLARSYAEAMRRLSRELEIKDDCHSSLIARMPDVFNVKRAVPDEEQLWVDVKSVVDAALTRYNAMRMEEGGRLAADILGRRKSIAASISDIEARSGGRLERYRERITAKMMTVLESTDIEENRILLEAAIYADKSAIDEETVRLRSHLQQFDDIIGANEPVGRKLDFLIQEINREINTIGSKAADFDITSVVVDVKAEIEKIREQIQNIE